MLMPRSDVLKRHIRSHTAQDEEDDGVDDDEDEDEDDCTGLGLPGRSTSRSPQGNDASLNMTQQQRMSVEDLSTVLGLPATPASALSADRSDWLSTLDPTMLTPPGLSGLSNPWDAFFLSMDPPVPSGAMSILSRKHSLGSDIPDERFKKLARLWPKKREPQWSLIQTLWTDAARHKGTNLFSDSCPQNADNDGESLLPLPSNGPQRDLDDARRLSLIQFMLSVLTTVSHLPYSLFLSPLPPLTNLLHRTGSRLRFLTQLSFPYRRYACRVHRPIFPEIPPAVPLYTRANLFRKTNTKHHAGIDMPHWPSSSRPWYQSPFCRKPDTGKCSSRQPTTQTNAVRPF